ncbi:MAG: serine hydrolase [Methylotenera sp.]|nr:serine hydrolase [Methylotenera sp.]
MKYLLVGLLLLWQNALAELNPFPNVASAYLVQVNKVALWEKQASVRLPPASLTKLMAALLVIESTPLNATVIISDDAVKETGSRLGLQANSKFYVEDLLKATLLNSSNDACHAIADHVAGNEKAFVILMNIRARQMGLLDTHFQNACGHDADKHYSTANDLANLANRLLENGFIQTTVKLRDAKISSLDGNYSFQLTNKNALLGRYDGVAGLKTGYTSKAGKCLIAYATRNQKNVLLVLLNAPNRWWDAVDILDLAFGHAT